MLFYDQIDKKQTVKKAKSILCEYSRYLKIIGSRSYDIDVKSKFGLTLSFSTYVNTDAKMLDAIEKKDRDYSELDAYIKSIQTSINKLDLEQIELLNFKYIDDLTLKEIEERFRTKEKDISERQIRRKLKKCYLDFAISHGIYVIS